VDDGRAVVVDAAGSPVRGAETQDEVKELDKLQGYDSLPGEKSVKKDMMKGANLPVETIIVWSEANPNKGAAPLKVAFVADPPPNVPDAFYTWNFGDDSAPTTGQSVAHTFTKPGIYKVILKVSNTSGALGEDELRIKVTQQRAVGRRPPARPVGGRWH
jgi:hypothetical protein